MRKVSSFDVLKFMSENNEDIRLAPLSNIIAGDKKGDKHTLTIGVDAKTFEDFMSEKKLVGGLIIADGKRFSEIQEALSEDPNENVRV